MSGNIKQLIADIREEANYKQNEFPVLASLMVQVADQCEILLAQNERALEALNALKWSDPWTHESGSNELVIKYRLGAFIDRADAEQAVILYGLGRKNPDKSVLNNVDGDSA